MSSEQQNEDFSKFVAENQYFLEMLSSTVADRAIEKLDRNSANIRQRNAVFITVGGALIVAGLTGVATLFSGSLRETARQAAVVSAQTTVQAEIPTIILEAQTSIESSLNDFVSENTRQAQSSWNDSRALLTIDAMVREIDERGSFSEGEARALLNLISPFSRNQKYLDFADFTSVLEGVIDSFVQAERNDLIAPLETQFGELMLAKEETVVSMVLALGRELIIANFEPTKLSEDKLLSDWTVLRNRYNSYADAARILRFPELPYVFDVVISCMLDQPDQETQAYVKAIEKFSPDELNTVVRLSVGVMTDTNSSEFARGRAVSCLEEFKGLDTTGSLSKALDQ